MNQISLKQAILNLHKNNNYLPERNNYIDIVKSIKSTFLVKDFSSRVN